MLPAENARVADGSGPSFLKYEQQAGLRRRVTNLDPSKRAVALILQTGAVARRVCLAAGSHVITNDDGVERALAILRDYFAPEAANSAYHEVARLLQCKRTAQTMGVCLAECAALRRKSQHEMRMGGSLSETFVSVPYMHTAALSGQEKSLLLATARGGVGFPDVAEQT